MEIKYAHGDSSWWQEARFGMFIHWGLYALPARQEWVKNYEKLTNEAYQKYFDRFDPDLYDPAEWAREARKAGMKYVVFTAKHHDGFCMWDSKHTGYKVTNTPCGRDLLRELLEAFRAENIRTGIYYSLLDWHHPEFTVDSFHPLRDVEEENEKNKRRDMKIYARYMRDQVTELLTKYGRIDVMWFDFSYPAPQYDRGKGRDDWESEKLLALVRKLQPDILIDDRLDLPGAGDFRSPEQYVPSNGMRDEKGNLIPWEGCQTFSGAWGYCRRDHSTWKSDRMLLEILIQHVSRSGNMLMNVGPTGRGYLDKRALNMLRIYAEWMKYHSRAIHGCTMAPEEMTEPENCRYTYNPETNRLYLHLMAWPFKFIHLPNLAGKVEYAQLLLDGSEITFRDSSQAVKFNENTPKGAISLDLPTINPDTEIPVIELFLK